MADAAPDDEIEITPVMIEAGEAVLCRHYLDLVDVADGARAAVVREILAIVGIRSSAERISSIMPTTHPPFVLETLNGSIQLSALKAILQSGYLSSAGILRAARCLRRRKLSSLRAFCLIV